jgi:hypothetical protein
VCLLSRDIEIFSVSDDFKLVFKSFKEVSEILKNKHHFDYSTKKMIKIFNFSFFTYLYIILLHTSLKNYLVYPLQIQG